MVLSALLSCMVAALGIRPIPGGFGFVDDYEDANLVRSGSPELIRSHFAPGILTETGKGVYRTLRDVRISPPPPNRYRMPPIGDLYPLLFVSARVYDFGIERRTDAELAFGLFNGSAGRFRIVLRHRTEAKTIEVVSDCSGSRKTVGEIPCEFLPAECVLTASSDGNWRFDVTVLPDEKHLIFTGYAEFLKTSRGQTMSAALELKPLEGGGTAEVTIDQFEVGIGRRSADDVKAPFKVKPEETFDPRKAGWPLVFSDDFDGTDVDWCKWYQTPWWRSSKPYVSLDGKGHLLIRTDFEEDGELHTGRVYSRGTYRYGYIEAGIKLTRNNGWWAAYWLYGDSNLNPFLDGFEIDIFEDFYSRRLLDENGVSKGFMTHNFHLHGGDFGRSFSYRAAYPRGFDEFFTLGCKWTPFEISFYVNGRLVKATANHSPHESATYDAFNHCTGTMPLHLILNGEIMGAKNWTKDISNTDGWKFPECFEVDFVRIWEYPGDKAGAPRVAWTNGETNGFAVAGEKLRLTVDAAAEPDAAITDVMLFDNGYFLAALKEPPYVFDIELSEKGYEGTGYMKPGNQGGRPSIDGALHAYVVFVKDSEDRVGYTAPVWKIPRKPGWSVADIPGEPVFLPGTVSDRIINRLQTAEWRDYAVDAGKGGVFDATLMMGSDTEFEHRVTLLVDGAEVGTFILSADKATNKNPVCPATLRGVRIGPGRHVLTITPNGRPTLGTFSFARTTETIGF